MGLDKIKKVVIYFCLFIWLIITGYPLVFLLQNSFKSRMEFFTNPVWSFSKTLNFQNYIDVIKSGFHIYFINSIVVCFISVGLIVLVSSLASYAISRIEFRYNKIVYVLFVAGMMIPIHATLIPIYKLSLSMHIYDKLMGLVGPYVAFSLPISIFILTGFMNEIPYELEEAATIDGANRFQIFSKIVLPLVKPAISTITIYNLTLLWNEFIYALILISNPEKRTLTLGLFNFQGAYGVNIPLVLTAVVLSILPIIIIYIFLQDKIIKGMTAGALKG
ncbi:MAG: carbohydrate ABC transporter permease [Firmicutes bacterium]|nr:carbohydrate ABC transporter permease [Bacillota bacterium]